MSVSGIISSFLASWTVGSDQRAGQSPEVRGFWEPPSTFSTLELGVGQPAKGAGNHMGQKDKLSSEN